MNPKTVLFVDDEELILKTIQRIVVDRDFNALFASSGAEALAVLQEHPVHVIVTDMRMPGMSGLDLLATIKDTYPHIVRIVLSGFTEVTTMLAAINDEQIFRYITKPWESQDELVSIIEEALERASEAVEPPMASTAPAAEEAQGCAQTN